MAPLPCTIAVAVAQGHANATQNNFPEAVEREPGHGNNHHDQQRPEEGRFDAEGFEEVGKGFVHGPSIADFAGGVQ